MRKTFFITIIILVLFLLINKVSQKLIPDHTNYELLYGLNVPTRANILPWLNFDGLNYLEIVEHGYKDNRALTAFFPVYPLLIRLFSIDLRLNPIIVGILISYVSTILALLMFYRYVERETKSALLAFKALALLLVFPSSFYLFAYYTEGFFLLLTILFFWHLKKGNFAAASLFAMIASATRLFGLALAGTLFVEAFFCFRKTGKIPFIVFLSPLGFVIYAVYLGINFGNPFLMFLVQSDQKFGRTLSILNPVKIIPDTVSKILAGSQMQYDNVFVYPVILIEATVFVYLIFLTIRSFGKIRFYYWSYLLFSLILIMVGGSLSSVMRYSLPLIPAYIFLAKNLKGVYFIIWLIISFFLLIFSSSLFFRNYWIA